jgi:DNA end-binding protein Ku
MKRLFAGIGIAAVVSGAVAKLGLPKRISELLRRRDGLDRMTKEDLYKRAQEADIPGRSDMTKDELVAALRGAGNAD